MRCVLFVYRRRAACIYRPFRNPSAINWTVISSLSHGISARTRRIPEAGLSIAPVPAIAHALAQIKLSNGWFFLFGFGVDINMRFGLNIYTSFAVFILVFVCRLAPSSLPRFFFVFRSARLRPVPVQLLSTLCVWHFYEWPSATGSGFSGQQIPLSSPESSESKAIKCTFNFSG